MGQGRLFQSAKRGVLGVYSQRRKAATVTASVLALALGYHVVFGHNGLIVYKQKRDETRALEEQTQELQRENDRLKEHTDRLQNDPNAIEHQAREELHYTRPGEVIYTMPASRPSDRAAGGGK
jgi:cell division protein FtsB